MERRATDIVGAARMTGRKRETVPVMIIAGGGGMTVGRKLSISLSPDNPF